MPNINKFEEYQLEMRFDVVKDTYHRNERQQSGNRPEV